MFQRLFGRDRGGNRAITEALYAEIVAAARQPVLYSEWEVPDTPLGRFEMLSLHMFLFQHRVRGEAGALREIAQTLTDDFFAEVEHSLRDLGIGDMGVPKRMKKLARMFYGRTAAYADALERNDRRALAEALSRNIRPDSPAWPQAESLALYVMEVENSLRQQSSEAIRRGAIQFPPISAN
jgi:cytochrome b pre-mRNA-processing protein 3